MFFQLDKFLIIKLSKAISIIKASLSIILVLNIWIKKIYSLFTSLIIFLTLHTNFICEDENLNLTIRNNLNGDFAAVENITDIKPGAFINISWNDINLMLPYSPRVGSISFSDKKWDFRYNFKDDIKINEDEPLLYELLPNGQYITHECILKN